MLSEREINNKENVLPALFLSRHKVSRKRAKMADDEIASNDCHVI